MAQASEEQVALCQRFGSPVATPAPNEKLGIAIATLSLKPLNALRHSPSKGTCGWYIWGGEVLSQRSDFFQPLHMSHLSEYCPTLLPYLALVPGWRVLLAPGQEEVWYDKSLLGTEV